MQSLYRRTLPPEQIDFRAPEGRDLLRACLDAGTAGPFFRLIANLHTQAEPSWCGLGTLVTVLNALEIDPQREWKGPWRWFGEELLDCCLSLEEATAHGLTLMELGVLAQCNGADVNVVYASDDSLPAFREAIQKSATTETKAMVVGYSRAALSQTGDGHYSPIGAWDPASG